jgi:hypothetical protein
MSPGTAVWGGLANGSGGLSVGGAGGDLLGRRDWWMVCGIFSSRRVFLLCCNPQPVLYVICYRLSVICYLLSVICVTCYLLSVICYLLSVICYLLSVICHLSSVISLSVGGFPNLTSILQLFVHAALERSSTLISARHSVRAVAVSGVVARVPKITATARRVALKEAVLGAGARVSQGSLVAIDLGKARLEALLARACKTKTIRKAGSVNY